MPSEAEISRVMSLMGRKGGKKGGKTGGKMRWVGVSAEERRRIAAAGGKARAPKLTPKQRSDSARKAALARAAKRKATTKPSRSQYRILSDLFVCWRIGTGVRRRHPSADDLSPARAARQRLRQRYTRTLAGRWITAEKLPERCATVSRSLRR